MGRYIDADECLDTMRDEMAGTGYQSIAMDIIKYAPTADVVEVKRGEWKRKGQDIYCSVCGNESAYNPFGASKFSDYCPNCGADMRGEEK